MATRPLSPHLQIYKLPLAAIISISHRIVGVALFASIISTAAYCLLTLCGINLQLLNDLIFSWFGKLKISFLGVGIIFYTLSEIRYIIWGLNCGFDKTFIKLSNFIILGATIALGMLFINKVWE